MSGKPELELIEEEELTESECSDDEEEEDFGNVEDSTLGHKRKQSMDMGRKGEGEGQLRAKRKRKRQKPQPQHWARLPAFRKRRNGKLQMIQDLKNAVERLSEDETRSFWPKIKFSVQNGDIKTTRETPESLLTVAKKREIINTVKQFGRWKQLKVCCPLFFFGSLVLILILWFFTSCVIRSLKGDDGFIQAQLARSAQGG